MFFVIYPPASQLGPWKGGSRPALGPLCSQALWLPHLSQHSHRAPAPARRSLPAFSLGWEAFTQEFGAGWVLRDCRSCCSLSCPSKRTWLGTPGSTVWLRQQHSPQGSDGPESMGLEGRGT